MNRSTEEKTEEKCWTQPYFKKSPSEPVCEHDNINIETMYDNGDFELKCNTCGKIDDTDGFFNEIRSQTRTETANSWITVIKTIIKRCEEYEENESDYQKHVSLGLRRILKDMKIIENTDDNIIGVA